MLDEEFQQAKILIIDDEILHIDFLKALLRQHGYRQIEAETDPRRAIETFEKVQPDLVLLDLLMTGVGGMQVLKQLRTIAPRESDLPIFVLTSDLSPEVRREAFANGVDDYVVKPYDSSEVLARVRRLLRTRLLHSDPEARSKKVAKRKASDPTREELEQRVRERTEDLAVANAALSSASSAQEQVQFALQRSEERLKLAIAGANLGTWDWNIMTNETHCSARTEEMFGLTPGSGITYQRLLQAVHPDDQPRVRAAVMRSVSTLEPLEVRYRIIWPDGSLHWVSGRAGVRADGSGRAVHMHGTVHDITARTLAEQALKEVESKFETVIATMPAIVFIKDLRGRYLLMNKRFDEIFGIKSTEMIGKTLYDFMPAVDAAKGAAHDREVLEKGQAVTFEETLPASDGDHVFQVTKFPLLDDQGQVYALCGIATDITEQKRTEKALRESEVRYSAIVANVPGMVFRSIRRPDRSVEARYVNEGCRELLGIEPEDFANDLNIIPKLIHPDERDDFVRSIGEALRSGDEWRWQGRVRLATGEIKWIQGAARAQKQADGNTAWDGLLIDITEQKRAVEALHESEARFSGIVANAPGMVYRIVRRSDDSVVERFVSEGCRELLGFAPEHFSRDPELMSKLVHPDDLSNFVRENQEALRLRRDWRWEGRVRLISGEEKWIQGVCRPQARTDGLWIWDGFLMDITDRKRTEEALRESDERYHRIASNAPAVVYQFVYRPDGSMAFPYLSEGCRDLLGLEAQAIQTDARPLFRMIDSEDRVVFTNSFRQSRRTLEPWNWVGRIRLPSGKLKWVQGASRPQRYPNGDIVWDGLLMDITQRKLAEGEVEVRGRQQAAVSKLGELGLAGVELQQLFDEAVSLVAETLNVEFSKLLEILPGGDLLLLRAGVGWKEGLVGHATEETGLGSHAGYALLSDGPVIMEDLRTERRFNPPPLFVEHHVVSGVTVVIRTPAGPFGVLGAHSRSRRHFSENDLNFLRAMANIVAAAVARRSVEQTLRDAKEEADRANAAKSEFLSRMSHELRTPLNAIVGFAQLAELDASTADEQENVEQIQNASNHLLQLINEILDLSSIEAGRLHISIKPVPLHHVVKNTIALVRPLALQREIEIEESPCDQYVLADDRRLQQVLLNLLSNAIKYNKEGGKVTISSSITPRGFGRVEVSDTGIGIDSFDLAKVFEPFQRLQNGDEPTEGIGLGLAIAQRLLKKMGGAIGVESQRGSGSTFWFELPAAHELWRDDEPLPLIETLAGEQTAPGAEQTLLYIEDDSSNLKLVERIIARRPGLNMIAAQQASIGLELARQFQPDIILLDLHLPDMSGDQVIVWLKSDQQTARIPVVMLSANAIGAEIERLKKLGAAAYITKPFQVPDFLREIEGVLAQSSRESPDPSTIEQTT